MAFDPSNPQDQFADKWAQAQHAEEIRQRRRDGQEPEGGKDESQLNALIDSRVKAAVDAALANFTIKQGQGAVITGAGRNITVGVAPVTPAVQPLFTPEWFELTLCDGTTLEVAARNIVPP